MELDDFIHEKFQMDRANNRVARKPETASGDVTDFPIEGGIYRFVGSENYASSFGFQWNQFKSTQLDSNSGIRLSFQHFWNATKLLPKDLFGKTVVEAGSGAGRYTEVLLGAGASVITFDYSAAIDANRQNNKDKGDVAFLQADIADIPLRNDCADYVICLGVMQHLQDAEAAMTELARIAKPGAEIFVDFYEKMDRLDPHYQPKYFWRKWTRGMDHEKLLGSIRTFMRFWFPIDDVVRRVPFLGPKTIAFLRIPCWNYMRSGLSREQRFEWAVLDTFDALAPTYDQPWSLEDVSRLAAKLPMLEDVDVYRGGNGVMLRARKGG